MGARGPFWRSGCWRPVPGSGFCRRRSAPAWPPRIAVCSLLLKRTC